MSGNGDGVKGPFRQKCFEQLYLETLQNSYALVSEVVSFLVSQKGRSGNIWKIKRITEGTRQASLLPI